MCLVVSASSAQQSVRLADAAVLAREPGGTRLARLPAGAPVTRGRTRGEWMEVRVEGWIWTASTSRTTRDGFDLIVSADGGENVRAAPDGNVVARAEEGALLERLGARGGWTRVRRSGWIARSALPAPRQQDARQGLGAGTGTAVRAPRADSGSVAAGAPPAPGPDTVPASRAQEGESSERRAMLPRGVGIHRTAGGERVADLRAPTEVTVGQRDRDWVRVRVEGWVRASDLAGSPPPPPVITAAQIREQPERYVGQQVEWRVQFLAHQRADELRPEMPLGQPYLLTRGPMPETGFVYVMVSREQASALVGLEPLDELSVTVTIRSGRTRYLATPVVDLVRVTGK